MPFFLVKSDITTMKTDAIVNAANTALSMGGGVCGAIFKAAGIEEMESACAPLAPIKTADAVLTAAFNLPSKFVIHTAGPVYRDGNSGEEAQLRACYTNSLALAKQYRCKSIAFPLISSGIYGYPKEEALRVAADAIQGFLQEHEMEVHLVLFETLQPKSALLEQVDRYLDTAYDPTLEQQLFDVGMDAFRDSCVHGSQPSLEDMLQTLDEPFCDSLLRLIQQKKKTEVQVYKKANLDRKHFSKIRSGNGYMPGRKTILALAVALELSLEEAQWLLGLAGYSLSHASKFDVIVEYCLTEHIYDIFAINEILFSYDQPLLGS